jgi:hypothetical protein
MTRDEILSMPAGREMNELIAEKVMGWDIHPASPDPWERELAWYSDDGKLQGGYGYWRPSENIADAWQVIDKADWYWELFPATDIYDVTEIVCRLGFEAGTMGDCSVEGEAKADTPELAICRAALLAVLT